MTLDDDRALAADTTTRDDVLLALLADRDWHVRWNAAQNAGAGDAVRIAALCSGDKDLASAVGQLGDALSPPVLEAVLTHPLRDGREQLGLTATDEATLDRLASDPDAKVRAAVASRWRAVPDGTMRRLAADRLAPVRAAVAANTGIPHALAVALASDRSALVRWWLLVMRDGDARFARLLRDDRDELIRNHARGVLGEPGDAT